MVLYPRALSRLVQWGPPRRTMRTIEEGDVNAPRKSTLRRTGSDEDGERGRGGG